MAMAGPERVIDVSALVKRYGALTAVDDVSFEVYAGEIFGMVGPNGAGKTTTIECIEGLRKPDSGTVRVLGMSPGQIITVCPNASVSSSRRPRCLPGLGLERRWTCSQASTVGPPTGRICWIS